MNERDLTADVVDAAERLLDLYRNGSSAEVMRGINVLSMAVRQLRVWQEHANEPDRAHVRVKTCKNCEAVFFFAQYGTDDEGTYGRAQWIPLEIDPIDCDGVLLEWRWQVNFDAWPPRCSPNTALANVGPVWVDHRQTCGASSGPKKRCVPYERRWKANSAKINAETDNQSVRFANELAALKQRLQTADDKEHDD